MRNHVTGVLCAGLLVGASFVIDGSRATAKASLSEEPASASPTGTKDKQRKDEKAQNRRTGFVIAALNGKPIAGVPVNGGGKVAGDPCKERTSHDHTSSVAGGPCRHPRLAE